MKLLLILICALVSYCAIGEDKKNISEFTIENPYSVKKKHEWRASLHNHSRFEPNYTHAPIPPAERLREHRDAKLVPPYGIVVITDHGRITLPGNTDPVGKEPQWGIEGILFVPGIEGTTGFPTGNGKIWGEVCCVGVSREYNNINDQSSYHHNNSRKGRYSKEEISQMIKEDVFVALCHPNSSIDTDGVQKWNSTGYTYDELDIIFGNQKNGIKPFPDVPYALEIGNIGYDFNEKKTRCKNAEEKWDYLLSQGIKIWGTASDDSHGKAGFEGWIVVYMDELTQEEFLKSLKRGNFYASQGPVIEDIRLKDKTLTLKTDKPSRIEFIGKNGTVLKSEDNVTESSYTINGSELYVRGRITRECPEFTRSVGGGIGKRRSAWTNPVYIEISGQKQ